MNDFEAGDRVEMIEVAAGRIEFPATAGFPAPISEDGPRRVYSATLKGARGTILKVWPFSHPYQFAVDVRLDDPRRWSRTVVADWSDLRLVRAAPIVLRHLDPVERLAELSKVD